jgi:hypothetical protein
MFDENTSRSLPYESGLTECSPEQQNADSLHKEQLILFKETPDFMIYGCLIKLYIEGLAQTKKLADTNMEFILN